MSAKVAPMIEAAEAGWNACRRQVYLLSEDYIERTHALKGGDTVEGNFYRGQYDVAKSFAKAFNAFEALDCDYFKQIDFSALTNTSGDDEAPVAWRWRFDKTGNWHFGVNKPSNFRFGAPDEIEPVYARPQSASVRDGWMPIETAPKDYTPIWIGHTSGIIVPAVFARIGSGFWRELYTDLPVSFNPTHWMPLPRSPGHSLNAGGVNDQP